MPASHRVALAAAVLQLCLTGASRRAAASEDKPEAAAMRKLPVDLRPPTHNVLALSARARGVQIYVCKPRADDASKLEWTLLAPEADLFDGSGNKIGKHYAGPTWESTDGSKVVGEVTRKAAAPDSIPWLLLKAKSTGGKGAFSRVTYIQRLETRGGNVSTTACDSSSAGKEQRVDYTALYAFYVTKGRGSKAVHRLQ